MELLGRLCCFLLHKRQAPIRTEGQDGHQDGQVYSLSIFIKQVPAPQIAVVILENLQIQGFELFGPTVNNYNLEVELLRLAVTAGEWA